MDPHYLQFLKAFVKHPWRMGSVVPSSEALVNQILKSAQLSERKSIVQLGIGTGVVSRSLFKQKSPEAKFLGIDLDPEFVASIKQEFPGKEFVIGSAEFIDKILEDKKFGPADLVLSTLPWTLFAPERQKRIIEGIEKILLPTGVLVGYIYAHALLLPSGQRFHEQMSEHFDHFSMTQIIWRNVPPAFVFRCAAPRRSQKPRRNRSSKAR